MDNEIELEYRGAGEFQAAVELAAKCFGRTDTQFLASRERHIASTERWVVARESGHEIGQVGVHPMSLSVPGGGAVRGAGVTWVGVLPEAAGRGVMHAMMNDVHRACLEAGEAVAVLGAAHPRMYQKLGYGMAIRQVTLSVPTESRFATNEDLRVADVALDGVGSDLHLATQALALIVPGVPIVPAEWSAYRLHPLDADPARLRAARATDDGGLRGVLLWEEGDVLRVHELVSLDHSASASLLQHARTQSPGSSLRCVLSPADVTPTLVSDWRAVQPVVSDRLHMRILDIAAALSARASAADVDAVMEVAIPDARGMPRPERFRVVARAGHSMQAQPTTASPSVHLTSAALASMYLGDARLMDLERAGLARTNGSAAARSLGHAFWSEATPWNPISF